MQMPGGVPVGMVRVGIERDISSSKLCFIKCKSMKQVIAMNVSEHYIPFHPRRNTSFWLDDATKKVIRLASVVFKIFLIPGSKR